jgi:hypothetical protein
MVKTTLEMKINGLLVTLDPDMEGDGIHNPNRVTGCWIEHKDTSCSLQWLIDNGTVDEDGIAVSESTIKKIEDWALANGY